ncbi:hypothetical protein PTSG_12905 [Salpingoeca rosetta]|uniref:Uncharacterized protein n=1 Tax=Salpingoeca rosetta (strain ATCC 50818 / BSB-021) TaxID=946362 RepID=F2ULJ7_SALR5|nr:uncharacterized protein PTSG_12905 [Salpingoeca rosetta]EGD77996.1 hypothetical protein PTSG_12905 [Salpingoeca rosetta]|eukprot:XP_004990058.1 hypothetical protein PTSG_12905 [Salpingoeca rosetta]
MADALTTTPLLGTEAPGKAGAIPSSTTDQPNMMEPVQALHMPITAHTPLERPRVADKGRAIFQRVAARDDDDLATILQCGLDSILDGMRAHPDSVGVQLLAFKALLTLLSNDTDHTVQSELLQLQGVETICATMERHIGEDRLADIGCCTLYCLIEEQEGRLAFMGADGVALLGRVMQTHPYSRAIQEHACWIVDALARTDKDNVPLLLQEGCVTSLVQALRTHASSTTLVDWALKATHTAMLASYLVKEEFRAVGGVQLLVAVLDAHNSHPDIMETCLAVMCLLSDYDMDNSTDFAHAKLQNSVTIVDLLSKLVGSNTTPVHVLVQTVQLLYLLNTKVPSLRDASASRLVAPVIACMRVHHESVELLHGGCSYLHVIMSQSPDRKELVLEAGGLAVLLQALDDCLGDQGVVTAVLLGLLSLSVRPTHRKQLLDASVLKSIMRVMAVHEGTATIEQYGCWILENMSLDAAGQHMIAQAGGLALFQRLVQNYQAETDSCSRDVYGKAVELLRKYQEGEGVQEASSLEMCQQSLAGCTIS